MFWLAQKYGQRRILNDKIMRTCDFVFLQLYKRSKAHNSLTIFLELLPR